MIDVKRTILDTIKDAIYKMRFLGLNNPMTLKKIVFLIVLDDLFDWSDYLEEKQSILKALLELRTDFILNNPEFLIYRTLGKDMYINVNTPQTNVTWSRVWDIPDVLYPDLDEITIVVPTSTHAAPFTPDPTCPTALVYFGTGEKIPAGEDGTPAVDFATLTICEKMNIYINRDTGKMFFLDPATCTWQLVRGQLADTIDWDSIDNKPDIYSSILHSITEDNNLNVTLSKAEYNKATGKWNYGEQSSDIPVTDSNPDPDENNDLNDIL